MDHIFRQFSAWTFFQNILEIQFANQSLSFVIVDYFESALQIQQIVFHKFKNRNILFSFGLLFENTEKLLERYFVLLIQVKHFVEFSFFVARES
jgi:hypothetical protein